MTVGQDVAVMRVPQRKLNLGAGVKDPDLLLPIEAAVGRKILEYFV